MYTLNEKQIFKTFKDLASISSPSGKEKDVIKYIQDEMKKLGITTKKIKCGTSHNLLIKIKGTDKTKEPIMFSSHTDTVTPCEKVKVVETDTKIMTDGTSILGSDDKAGVTAIVEAVKYIKTKDIPHGPIEILLTCQEEIGLVGAKNMDYSLISSKRAIVLDSGGPVGCADIEAPFHYTMKVDIKGKPAHAGMEPEKGISAIAVLAEIITKLPSGRIDERTTFNVGKINGGRANNIVAANATMNLEFRSLDKQTVKSIEKDVKSIITSTCKDYKAKSKIESTLEYSGYSIKENDSLLKLYSAAAGKLKIKPKLMSSGGGSDTNIFNANKIKAINISVGMSKVHTTEEFIKKTDLVKACKLVVAIIEEAGK